MNGSLRRISAEEFARRLKASSEEPDKRFAFFLGAGCSVSSGIPAAGPLVRDHWLLRLKYLQGAPEVALETWAKGEFPGYEPDNAAAFYGDVFQRLFLSPDDRQLEIERLCGGRFPGFGYAALSSLISLDGGRFNVVLTTNFDDLIADALYLFTPARPLVILHESLASYIRPTRTRPLIVKLHGDNRLSPQNTAQETVTLEEGIETQVKYLLNDRGLVFVGYGGNDKGIKKMLGSLPSEALPLGVFWVSGIEPKGEIRPWLESRDAIWVEKADFDELMLLVRDTFSLRHPDPRRFEQVFEQYTETYGALSAQVVSLPDDAPDASALKQAVERTDQSFPNWWAVDLAARRLKDSDPDQADHIYRKGLMQFPSSADLQGIYAIFLKNVRKDYDGAEENYRSALSAEPNSAIVLGNYAFFLEDVRKDYDGAEEHYRRALSANPNHARNLGNYASLLSNVMKDYDKAEEYYERSIAADPTNAYSLGNYSGLLLGRGRRDEGLVVLEKVLPLLIDLGNPGLALECWFYALAHRSPEGRPEALKSLKSALVSGGRSPKWDLVPNIVQAKKEGHKDESWLTKLAAVIADEADIETMETWPDWKDG